MAESKTKRWLAVVRILVGVLFIHAALPKVSARFLLDFPSFVRACIAGNPFPWFAAFLQHVVLPNQQVFAILTLLGQLLIGVALLVGFLTGVASLAGVLYAACFLLATSHLAPGHFPFLPATWEAPGAYALLVLLLLFVTRAGRTWGLDARMAKSRSIFW